MLHVSDVTIELVMTPSSGIGATRLEVKVPAGTTVSFLDQRLKVESSDVQGPLFARFGTYDHGVYRDIGELTGPAEWSFAIDAIARPRPDKITVSLPDISINGQSVHAEPVRFSLSQRPTLVGLCQ